MRIFLSILSLALLLCLTPMPYGYYVLIRFATMVIMAVMAYLLWQKEKKRLALIFGAVALLFQPFVKMALERGIWNLVDVIVAIGLIIFIMVDSKKHLL